MPAPRDLTGQTIHHLTAIRRMEGRPGYWLFRCELCGTEKAIRASNVTRTSNPQKACGCQRGLSSVTHGRTGTLTHLRWEAMKRRVTSPQQASYHERALSYDPRWDDLLVFIDDVGECPGREYQLDRIDNERGYYSGNVRWATAAEQQRNRGNNRWVEYRGARVLLVELARSEGVDYHRLYYQIVERGLSAEEALERVRHLDDARKRAR